MLAQFIAMASMATPFPTPRVVAPTVMDRSFAPASSPVDAAAPTLVGLIETPDLSAPVISPDGRFVVYRRATPSVARNTVDLSWWAAPLTRAGPPRRIAGGGAPLWTSAGLLETSPPQWSPDSRWVYFRALGRTGVQIRRAHMGVAWDGGVSARQPAVATITRDAADIEDFQVLGDGHLVYRTGASRAEIRKAEAGETLHGVHIDQTIEVGQGLERAALVNGRLAAQRLSGQWFARRGLLGDRPSRYVKTDPRGRAARPATPTETATLLRTQPSPGGAVSGFGGQLARRDGSHGVSVSNFDGRTPPLRQVFADRVTNLLWRPGHDQLVVTTSDPALRQALWLWDLPRDQVQRLAASGGLFNNGGDAAAPCALGAEDAVCVAAGPLDPPHLVRIHLDGGAQDLLDRPRLARPGLDVIQARTLVWTDADHHRFGGVLMTPQPRSSTPLPLVITYYNCGGFVRGGTGDEWPLAPLAARGIASLCVDQTADIANPYDAVSRYEAALSGVRAIITQLANDRLIDPRQVGMGGLSFGSEATMWIVSHANLLAAASIASAQVEPVYYWFTDLSGQHPMLQRAWGLGDPDQTKAAWTRISPALRIDAIHTPVLMQLPEQEFRYSMELYAKLTEAGIPSDMYAYPDEPHLLTQPAHRLAAYQRNVDWFLFWLKQKEDPDPAKADQYRRWRAQAAVWTARFGPIAQPADQARSQSSTSASSNKR